MIVFLCFYYGEQVRESRERRLDTRHSLLWLLLATPWAKHSFTPLKSLHSLFKWLHVLEQLSIHQLTVSAPLKCPEGILKCHEWVRECVSVAVQAIWLFVYIVGHLAALRDHTYKLSMYNHIVSFTNISPTNIYIYISWNGSFPVLFFYIFLRYLFCWDRGQHKQLCSSLAPNLRLFLLHLGDVPTFHVWKASVIPPL